MSARDCFGVIVRTLGLISCGIGIIYSISVLTFLTSPNAPSDYSMIDYALIAGVCFAIALLLLRGSERVVRFTYRD